MKNNEKNLTQLFIPIFLETLFLMAAGMADTLMLSSVGDQAVGAVGTANTYVNMFILMFNIVSIGVMAVMTQNIGAGKPSVACQARNIGACFNLSLGAALSAFLLFGSRLLLTTIGVAPALEEMATSYMRIVGGCCFMNALIPIYSGYLRAFGHTKYPLYATIAANIVNVALNALFLFYFRYGVVGVAAATAISKLVNLALLMIFAAMLIHVDKAKERADGKLILKQIFKIGFPSALENMLYNIAMTLAIRFLNQMDASGFQVAARAYAVQIVTFSYAAGSSLAQANSIRTGWWIGRKQYDECYTGTRKAWFMGMGVSLCMSALIAATSPYFVGFLTDDPEMIRIVTRLLWIDLLLEQGRTTNMIYGMALKTCGDVLFPVIIGMIFMFMCTVGGTYVLGIRLGLMVIGCHISVASDECCRAAAMFLRWKSGRWKGKGLIK